MNRPRVIRGTRVKPLPLLPSGPRGVCSRPLHEARGLSLYASKPGRLRASLISCLRSIALGYLTRKVRRFVDTSRALIFGYSRIGA